MINYGRAAYTDEFYPPAYISGDQVQLDIGNEKLVDVAMLQYSINEQVMPIYGYNSYTYDAVMRGQRIVQGAFAINFRPEMLPEQIKSILYAKAIAAVNDTEILTKEQVDELMTMYMGLDINHPDALRIEKILDKQFARVSIGQSDIDAIRKVVPYFYGNDASLRDMGLNLKIKHDAEWQFTRIIRGIQINGMQVVVDTNGNPITEAYTFIAKDIINE